MSHRLLVIDDESGIREALRQVLEYEGYSVRVSPSGQDGLLAYQAFHPHLVLLDVKMAGMDGLETLSKLREQDPATLVVMISGHGTIATAVEATHRGAFDFLEKPLDTDRLLITLRNALAQRRLTADNARLQAVADTRYGMAGRSQALKEVLELIERVGPTGARVLITGENGTGKELVARALHQRSPRHAAAFVEVNCAAIPSELIESELFGHMKGSFTGAVGDRSGKFEQADGGTLFLDEVGDMTLAAQAKVLRALQEGIVTRVGGSKPIQVDVRVIAATNKALEQEIAAGRFREDLFYRLNVVPIHVPPLRERREDIPDLVACFAERLAETAGVPNRPFEAGALERLKALPWPGNVRELRNIVERVLILATGKSITAVDIERHAGNGGGEVFDAEEGGMAGGSAEPGSFASFKEDAERSFIEAKLKEHGWNVAETARALQMPRSNLYKKIERYGLSRGSA
jgi:two-component system nitrogen regulation response regulator NtrX